MLANHSTPPEYWQPKVQSIGANHEAIDGGQAIPELANDLDGASVQNQPQPDIIQKVIRQPHVGLECIKERTEEYFLH